MLQKKVLLALVFPSLVAAAELPDEAAWSASYDAETGERFVPVELWSGARWDGSRELRMLPADLTFGKGTKKIAGPIEWKRPGTGETVLVYERLQYSRDGRKTQLFTVNNRKDGMARVFDSRYDDADCDENKFPLGLWKEGETRHYELSCNGGKRARKLRVTIEKIDHIYNGQPHCLTFHWVLDKGIVQNSNNHYIYCPGEGLVNLRYD